MKPLQGETVFVTVYEHKHGVDVGVYATEEAAIQFRKEIALEYWDDLMFEDIPENSDTAADAYWHAANENGVEWMSIEARVIGG